MVSCPSMNVCIYGWCIDRKQWSAHQLTWFAFLYNKPCHSHTSRSLLSRFKKNQSLLSSVGVSLLSSPKISSMILDENLVSRVILLSTGKKYGQFRHINSRLDIPFWIRSQLWQIGQKIIFFCRKNILTIKIPLNPSYGPQKFQFSTSFQADSLLRRDLMPNPVPVILPHRVTFAQTIHYLNFFSFPQK